MRRDYQRNADDRYSDPDVLATQYQVGKSAFFEVQLTIAENESRAVSGGSSSGSGGTVNVSVLDGGTGGGGGGYYCPERSQYVWVESCGVPFPMEAVLLVGRKDLSLFNPLTGNFNKLLS